MKAAVLFCHTDEQEPNAAVERELGRQYTQLSQYANAYGFELEQVFFHVGQLDYEHPDDVLLRFLRGLQNSRSKIINRRKSVRRQSEQFAETVYRQIGQFSYLHLTFLPSFRSCRSLSLPN